MISFACDKCGKECFHKEEITSLQADLQDSKDENIKLMSLYKESKEESSNLKINFEILKVKYEMLESQKKSLIIDNQNQLNYLVSSMIYFLNDSKRIELLLSTLEKE